MFHNYEKPIPLSKYIEDKIKMLKRDFCCKLTETEIVHIKSLKSEIAVDRYARKLINERLK